MRHGETEQFHNTHNLR